MSRSNQAPLPSGWIPYPFWAIAKEKVVTGQESEGLLSVYLDRGVIPYSEGGGLVHKPADSLEKYQLVDAGDFVMNNQQAWRGSVGVSKYRGIVSPAYLVFSLDKSKLLPEYAAYMFRDRSYVEKYMLSSLSVGDIQRQVKWNHLRKIAVHIPSKEEQQALARYLDQKTIRIDALIDKKSRFIELLKEKRQAVITNVVTKGLNPSSGMRMVDTDYFGVVASHWKIVPLKSVAYVELSNVDKKSIDGEPEVLLCNYVDVYRNEKITSRINFMRATASHQQIQRLRLIRGDVLLTKDSEAPNDIGVPSLVAENINAVCGYHLALARPKQNLLCGEFLAWFLRSHNAKAYFETEAKGMTRYGIDKSSLKDTPICLPPLDEQIAIASFLDRETGRLDALSEKTKRSIELLKEHRSTLITAAVTGKIDVRMLR